MNTNTLTTLRSCTDVVEQAAAHGHTIELLVDAQAVGERQYRQHFIVVDGEWDMTHRRNHKVAKAEYDNILAYWSEI